MNRKYIWIVICMLLGICMMSVEVQAENPRLMVSDYSVTEGSVVGGKEFDLKLLLHNTATKTNVKNIKVTIYTENGEFLPVQGAGAAYIESMASNQEEELTFQMEAAKGLEEKSYKLTIKMEYESGSGMEYTVEDTIFLPVVMEQRLSISDIYAGDEAVQLGDSVEVTAKINNLGEGTLYNVTVVASGDGIEETDTYVGNIESGKSGNVDIITQAIEVTHEGSRSYLTVVYEDVDGNVKEYQEKFYAAVTTPIYDDLELIKGEEKTPTDWSLLRWIVGVGVVVVIASVVIIRRAKRKKKILEEF